MNENSLYMPQQGQTFEQQKKKSTQRDDCAELQKNKLVALRVSSWNNGLYLIKKKCPWFLMVALRVCKLCATDAQHDIGYPLVHAHHIFLHPFN